MDQNLIACTNCNGQGLVSTGDNKLDLKRGNTTVCPVCGGKGKVDPSAPTPAPVANQNDPKEPDPSQDAPGGSGSSDSAGAGEIGPTIGDRCLTADNQPGTLGKNEAGDWVCNPDQ